MDLPELAGKILSNALKLGVETAAVVVRANNRKMIKLVNNEIATTMRWREARASLLLAKKGRVVVTSLSELDEKSIKEHLGAIVKTMNMLNPLKDYAGLPRGPFNYQAIPDLYDKNILELSVSGEDVELANQAIDSALEEGAQRTAGVLEYGETAKALCTSEAVEAFEKGTFIRVSLRAFLRAEESGHGVSCSRTLRDFSPEDAGRHAGKTAAGNVNSRTGEAGTYTVLLHPMVVANLFGYMTYLGMSAYSYDAGTSFLTGKLGEEVASDELTLSDNGRLANGLGSTAFDDEGVPTRETVLIEKGVLRNLLHNTRTASKFRVASTGNAGWLTPRPWNVVISPGNSELEDMIERIKKGLYVTNNWYTRFQNVREGMFSTICRDAVFYIENGEVKYPVKGLRISDRFSNILAGIIDASRERQQIYWWEADIPTLAPYLLVENVNVTRALGA